MLCHRHQGPDWSQKNCSVGYRHVCRGCEGQWLLSFAQSRTNSSKICRVWNIHLVMPRREVNKIIRVLEHVRLEINFTFLHYFIFQSKTILSKLNRQVKQIEQTTSLKMERKQTSTKARLIVRNLCMHLVTLLLICFYKSLIMKWHAIPMRSWLSIVILVLRWKRKRPALVCRELYNRVNYFYFCNELKYY